MNEGQAEFLDSDLLRDAEATAQRAALAPEADELKTTRLPPLTPPPPPPQDLVTSGIPPLPIVFPPPAIAPSFPPAVTGPDASSTGTTRYVSKEEAPAGVPKPSWLRALLASTFPPPTGTGTKHAPPRSFHVSPHVAGTVCAVLGLAFALVALVTGLRGAPSEVSIAPVVVAATVLARTFIALGAGALSFGLFRMAERLLVPPPAPRQD